VPGSLEAPLEVRRHRLLVRIAMLVVLAGAFWVAWRGCGGPGIRAGEEAPEFSIKDTRGRAPWTLQSFQGRPFALVFFATWCGACRDELPALSRIRGENPDLPLLLLSDEPAPVVGKFLESHAPTLDAAGYGQHAFTAYGIRAYPSVVVVGDTGKVVYAGEGTSDVMTGVRRLIEMMRGG
jgi:thiol-disulfide isomerase/thioredoxin